MTRSRYTTVLAVLVAAALTVVAITAISNAAQERAVRAQVACVQNFKSALSTQAEISARDLAVSGLSQQYLTQLVTDLVPLAGNPQAGEQVRNLLTRFREQQLSLAPEKNLIADMRKRNPIPSAQC